MWGPENEMRVPKYAKAERERRWLVDPVKCPDLSELLPVLIEDRYIANTRLRLRRMTDTLDGSQSLKLTKKYHSFDPRDRWIVTAYLTQAEYEVFAMLPAAIVEKERYRLVENGNRYSLDVFQRENAGLHLAEIECATVAELQALDPPTWAVLEVTEDGSYQGGALAR